MIEEIFTAEQLRIIPLSRIVNQVKNMVQTANYAINNDIYEGLNNALKSEESSIGVSILHQLKDNSTIALDKKMPICQDTGMAVFFIEVGQDIYFKNDLFETANLKNGTLTEAINEGVRLGYQEGYLRKSIVSDPFQRKNTGDNTPAVIHYDLVAGNQVKIHFAPKGFGSENMSRIYMIKPSDGIEGAKKVILETIDEAGPNACPPMVVGVGIGGNFEMAAILSKKALLRPINQRSTVEYVKELEIELIEKANQLGIGPQGLGGRTTVLGINVITHPTHIAGLPVAINISCHATRHSEVLI